jgi:uncharacterized protein DUF4258
MANNVYPLVPLPEPWTPAQATERIRRMAGDDEFDLILSAHAKEQMEERGITTPDVLYVLQNGFIYDKPEKATKWGLFKYSVICSTPNSNRRDVRVVTIPSAGAPSAKAVTVMWADEPMNGG